MPGLSGVATLSSAITQDGKLSDFVEAGGTISPHIAPVTGLQWKDSTGAAKGSAAVPQTGLGVNPTLSWTYTPPNAGDPLPTYYQVQIYDFFDDGTGNVNATANGQINTTATSVRIPSFFLSQGAVAYAVTVVANYSPGQDKLATPYSNFGSQSNTASTLTATFTP